MKGSRWIAGFTALAVIVTAIFLLRSQKNAVTTNVEAADLLPVVVIDAGHGGIDGGTSGKDGTTEKDINLSIAKKLESILTFLGYQVVMTRRRDDLISDPSLETVRQRKRQDILARLDLTNQYENSILISIHQNHYSDSFYSGTQVFYSKNNSESALLAQSIQDRVVTFLQPENTRAIKSVGSEIYLLDQCTHPAVMVECGFMSNMKELSLLKNEEYQTHMAFSIAIGLFDIYS